MLVIQCNVINGNTMYVVRDIDLLQESPYFFYFVRFDCFYNSTKCFAPSNNYILKVKNLEDMFLVNGRKSWIHGHCYNNHPHASHSILFFIF